MSSAPERRPGSVTPSTALLNQMLGGAVGFRALVPREIDLLRKSKQEIADRILGEPSCR
jgi:hypothetical protein